MTFEEAFIPVNGNDAHREKSQALEIRDLRTGSSYTIPIRHNAVSAVDFASIKASENTDYPADQDQNGLRVFDAGFQNTAVGESKVTYVQVSEFPVNTKPLRSDLQAVTVRREQFNTEAIPLQTFVAK